MMAVIPQVSWADSGPTWGRPGPRDRSQRRENGRGMPGGRFSGPGDHSGPISGHFRRFRARPPICDLNIVTLPQLRLLRHQHCVLRQDRCLFLQQKRCLLLRQDRCLLLRQDRCLLLRQDRCLLLRQDRCLLVRQGAALSHYFTSVLSQQKTFVLFQQKTSVLPQQQTCVLSQQDRCLLLKDLEVSDGPSGPKS